MMPANMPMPIAAQATISAIVSQLRSPLDEEETGDGADHEPDQSGAGRRTSEHGQGVDPQQIDLELGVAAVLAYATLPARLCSTPRANSTDRRVLASANQIIAPQCSMSGLREFRCNRTTMLMMSPMTMPDEASHARACASRATMPVTLSALAMPPVRILA